MGELLGARANRWGARASLCCPFVVSIADFRASTRNLICPAIQLGFALRFDSPE